MSRRRAAEAGSAGTINTAGRAVRGLTADSAAEHRWQALMRAEDAALNTVGVHEAWQHCLAAIADITVEREPWVMGGLSCSPMVVS